MNPLLLLVSSLSFFISGGYLSKITSSGTPQFSASSTSTTSMDHLSFISDICGTLKDIKRTGWVKSQVPLPESDSDHMHRCAMCALLLSQPVDPRDNYEPPNDIFHPARVDQARLLRMAVTHDVCESLAGDVTPICDPTLVNSKHAKENEAMKAIQKLVGDPLGEELYGLWQEYEAQKTPESKYCKDIDKFEMVVQAYEYEKKYLPNADGNTNMEDPKAGQPENVRKAPLRRFFESTNSVMKTPLFRRLDNELRGRREAMLKEKGWDVTEQERQNYR